jgi:hypothetical protein
MGKFESRAESIILLECKRTPAPRTRHQPIPRLLALLQPVILQLRRPNFEGSEAFGSVMLAIGIRASDSPAEPAEWGVAVPEGGLGVPVLVLDKTGTS